MSDVTLVILFNHNYEANIPRLYDFYKNRFSSIFFIMPFYSGDRDDVISVYDNSFYFQSYIVHALGQLIKKGFSNFMIIGDDLILNPNITERNYSDFFSIEPGTAFIPYIFSLNDIKEARPHRKIVPAWSHVTSALDMDFNSPGIKVMDYLPSYDEAIAKLASHNVKFDPFLPTSIFTGSLLFKRDDASFFKTKLSQLKLFIDNFYYITINNRLKYPLIGGYSDILILNKEKLSLFMKYAGVFSSLNLFVEMAIPTAMYLAYDRVITEKDLSYKGLTYWDNKSIIEFEKRYNRSLSHLVNDFPSNILYIHPIKLSRWN